MARKGKEQGDSTTWLIAIGVAVIAVMVVLSLAISEFQGRQERTNSSTAQPIQNKPEPAALAKARAEATRAKAQEAARPRELERIQRSEWVTIPGRSVEECIALSGGVFDNAYVECREGKRVRVERVQSR